MNTTLATERRHESSVHLQHPQPVRRVGLIDRAALHLGVALIKWGRRPGLPESERRANRLERALARRHLRATLEHEQAPLKYALLTFTR